MDIQKMLDAHMSKIRESRLSNSNQLMLGELKLKLESINGKNKPIIFDFGQKPAGACSWRGSYCELGLIPSETGGGSASWNIDRIMEQYDDITLYEDDSFDIPENPTAQNFLDMINAITGKTMTGYKGGDFVMHKNVAVYISEYGRSDIDNYKGEEYATVAPFDVVETEDAVVIVTDKVEY